MKTERILRESDECRKALHANVNINAIVNASAISNANANANARTLVTVA
jgi:hypothetical protein